jgi:hypothetical protein
LHLGHPQFAVLGVRARRLGVELLEACQRRQTVGLAVVDLAGDDALARSGMRDEPGQRKGLLERLVAEDVVAVPVGVVTIDTGLSVTCRSPPRMASPASRDSPVSTTIASSSPTMKVELPIAKLPGGIDHVSVKAPSASLEIV